MDPSRDQGHPPEVIAFQGVLDTTVLQAAAGRPGAPCDEPAGQAALTPGLQAPLASPRKGSPCFFSHLPPTEPPAGPFSLEARSLVDRVPSSIYPWPGSFPALP